MQTEIKQVGPGDEALFERVAEAVFDEPIDPSRLAAYLAAPDHHMLVALYAGEVVGQVAAVIHRHPDEPTELYVNDVGVTPALQRQGIARRMLDEMLAPGKALGCEEAWAGNEPDDGPARGRHESRGARAEPSHKPSDTVGEWSGGERGAVPPPSMTKPRRRAILSPAGQPP